MVGINRYKIIHDRESCIGCGACASVCPKYWEMDSDGKSNIIGAKKSDEYFTGGENLGTNSEPLTSDGDINNEAAESCPVNCIHIHEITEDGSDKKLI